MDMHTQDEQHTSWAKRLGKVLVILAVFGIGMFAGSYYGVKQYVSGDNGQVEISKILDLYGKTRSEEVSFDQFWDVWNTIKEKHVDQPVNDVDLFYGAVSGLVSGLDDPYSTYFPPAEAQEFARDLAGEFEGIGAEIGVEDGQLTIIAPLPQSPAEKAGLKAGDNIFAIDGKETFDMTLEQAVLNIRGEKGTTVVLTVSQNGLSTIKDVSVVRDTITVPTVNWVMKEQHIAYLRLNYFNETTWPEFDKAVSALLDAGAKGIVFDLRSNPGGFLQTSIDVASEWVESGVIVREPRQTSACWHSDRCVGGWWHCLRIRNRSRRDSGLWNRNNHGTTNIWKRISAGFSSPARWLCAEAHHSKMVYPTRSSD